MVGQGDNVVGMEAWCMCCCRFGGAMMRSGSGSAGAKCLALARAWAGRLAYTRRDGFAGEMA